jgi:DNA-binding NarL/FixJ family response regulator
MENDKNKRKILLVDDDEMMRIYFRDIFWVHGKGDSYDVEMVDSLSKAEKKIIDKETRPGVVFLDVMLPIEGENNSPNEQVKRSLSFVEKLKANKELSEMKIIIYSGQREKSIEEEFNKLGVNGYLVKGELMPKEIIAFTDKIHESNNKN